MALEPAQADLLGRIVEGATLDADTLRGSGALTDGSAEDRAQDEDEGAKTPDRRSTPPPFAVRPFR